MCALKPHFRVRDLCFNRMVVNTLGLGGKDYFDYTVTPGRPRLRTDDWDHLYFGGKWTPPHCFPWLKRESLPANKSFRIWTNILATELDRCIRTHEWQIVQQNLQMDRMQGQLMWGGRLFPAFFTEKLVQKFLALCYQLFWIAHTREAELGDRQRSCGWSIWQIDRSSSLVRVSLLNWQRRGSPYSSSFSMGWV